MSDAESHDVKNAAYHLIDGLPDDATWDDVMYRVYVRQSVDAGLRDADTGQVVDISEVRRRFGLAE